jgi:hypothetical protein
LVVYFLAAAGFVLILRGIIAVALILRQQQ